MQNNFLANREEMVSNSCYNQHHRKMHRKKSPPCHYSLTTAVAVPTIADKSHTTYKDNSYYHSFFLFHNNKIFIHSLYSFS